MSFQNLFKTKTIIGVALTVLALVAFNSNTQLPLNTEALTGFSQWYQETALKLSPGAELAEGNLPIKITITLNDPSRGAAAAVTKWELPKRSLLEGDERDNTLRVLGLIRESGVFGLRPLNNPSNEVGYLGLSIKDDQREFNTAIGLSAVGENIQLRNLLKLLEINSLEPQTSEVVPERL